MRAGVLRAAAEAIAAGERALTSAAAADAAGAPVEAAQLITDRKTNKEVADELSLSETTVETHLRNILAKLGVSSRVDVARAVERAG